MSSSYRKHLLLKQTNHQGPLNEKKSSQNYQLITSCVEKIFIIIINKNGLVKPLIEGFSDLRFFKKSCDNILYFKKLSTSKC